MRCTFTSRVAGNIAAGKYNDGTHEMRPILTTRIYDGIVASEERLNKQAVKTAQWKAAGILPAPRITLKADDLTTRINHKQSSLRQPEFVPPTNWLGSNGSIRNNRFF